MTDELTPDKRKPAVSRPLDAPHANRRRSSKRAAVEPPLAGDNPQTIAPVVPVDPQPVVPARADRIAARAFEIYQARGGEGGDSMNDWLQAEREIDAETFDGTPGV